VTVVRNTPSLARFDPAAHPARPFMADGTLRLVYAGALTPTYEVDVLLDAVALLREARPDLPVALDLYGRGDSEPALLAQVARLGLGDRVAFHGRIPIEAVPAAVAAADIGVAPTRRDRFTDISLSTKIFEYAAMGKPVVCSALPMVERTFPGGIATTYLPGSSAARRRPGREAGIRRGNARRNARPRLGGRGAPLRRDRGATRPRVIPGLTQPAPDLGRAPAPVPGPAAGEVAVRYRPRARAGVATRAHRPAGNLTE
jgi:hypothetical protein